MAKSNANDPRDLEIWERHIQRGESQTALAREYGLVPSRVSQIVKRINGQLPEGWKDDMRRQISGMLDGFAVELAKLAYSEPIPAYSNGRPIVEEEDEEGRPIKYAKDHSGRVKAMEAAERMMMSKRKMLGLDAPAEANVSQHVTYEIVGVDVEEMK